MSDLNTKLLNETDEREINIHVSVACNLFFSSLVKYALFWIKSVVLRSEFLIMLYWVWADIIVTSSSFINKIAFSGDLGLFIEKVLKFTVVVFIIKLRLISSSFTVFSFIYSNSQIKKLIEGQNNFLRKKILERNLIERILWIYSINFI